MDVRITWALPPDILITDEFDVFYKEATTVQVVVVDTLHSQALYPVQVVMEAMVFA
jgi:hypothetical protein